MKVKRFEDLEIWKLSVEISIEIYDITRKSKFSRDFSLIDQIRRAAISISSNIAEGFEMGNNNDLIRFLRISKGLSGELRSQLFISYKLKYINQEEFEATNARLLLLSSRIGKFITYLLEKKNTRQFLTR